MTELILKAAEYLREQEEEIKRLRMALRSALYLINANADMLLKM